MKERYPDYKQGEIDEVYSKLILEDKIALDKFLQKCAITSNSKKLMSVTPNL